MVVVIIILTLILSLVGFVVLFGLKSNSDEKIIEFGLRKNDAEKTIEIYQILENHNEDVNFHNFSKEEKYNKYKKYIKV